MGGCRDAESLSVYCRYAELYASSATYDGGLNELSQLTLKRNSALQSELDVYDNPEDLYEENRDWFDDEDEAWDYWYED